MASHDRLIDTGVYAIRNRGNGKVYVGSAARSLAERWRNHKSLLGRGKHYNAIFQHAWDKYGEAAFEFEVLERCPPESCVEREQFWMDSLCASERRSGYNIRSRAESNLGVKYGPEMGAKISASKIGKPRSPEVIAKMRARRLTDEHKKKLAESHLGIPLSEETKAKISASLTGQKRGEETKAKMSRAMTGKKRSAEGCANIAAAARVRESLRPNALGSKRSSETRAKLSEAAKNRSPELKARLADMARTPEARARSSAVHKGKVLSAETRAKVAASLRGRKLSAEHRAKIAAGLKAAYANNLR